MEEISMHVSHWRALRFAAMAFALSFSAALAADTTEPVTKTPYAPGEVIVKFKSDIRRNKVFMQQLYQEVGVAKVRKFKLGFGSIEHYQLAEGASVEKAIQKLTKTVAVEYAQPNYILKLFRNEDVLDGYDDCHPPVEFLGCVPFGEFIEGRPGIAPKPSPVEPPVADPQQNKVWGLNAISAPEAWKVTTGSQGIVVAVIDTGIDYNHEDLSFNMWRRPGVESEEDDIVGWDFVHDDNLPFDDHMHGTHVAGTIGAVGGNALGIVGVSPKVSLMAVKFLTARGSGTTLDAIRSIDYAVERGARILNNSWGGGADPNNNALRESIGRAEARGVLFVVAAGNDGTDNDRRLSSIVSGGQSYSRCSHRLKRQDRFVWRRLRLELRQNQCSLRRSRKRRLQLSSWQSLQRRFGDIDGHSDGRWGGSTALEHEPKHDVPRRQKPTHGHSRPTPYTTR